MRRVTFTEFRKDASALFSAVEEGETIRVVRHGKSIADISPVRDVVEHSPSWQRERTKKSIKGEELSSILLAARASR